MLLLPQSIKSFRITRFLARALTKPLGKLLCRPLSPLIMLLLPQSIKCFSPDDLPATLIKLLPVLIGSGVRPPLILGVHPNHGWVLANKGLRVKTLLQCLLSKLCLLSFLQLLQISFLVDSLLLIVIFVSLKGDNDIEKLFSLGFNVYTSKV